MAGPSASKPTLIREGVDVIDLDGRRTWSPAGWLIRFGLTLFCLWVVQSGEWRTIARVIAMSYRELVRGSPLATLECRAGDVRELRFAPDRESLLALYDDGCVRTWHLRTQRVTGTRSDGRLERGSHAVRMLLKGRDFDDRVSTAQERWLKQELDVAWKVAIRENDGPHSFHPDHRGDGSRAPYLEIHSRLRSLRKPQAMVDDGSFELYSEDLEDYLARFIIRALAANDPSSSIHLSAPSPLNRRAAAALGGDPKVTACALSPDRRVLALSWTVGTMNATAVWALPQARASSGEPMGLGIGTGVTTDRIRPIWAIDHVDLPPDRGAVSRATALSVSDDGTRLAIGCGSTIWVYSL